MKKRVALYLQDAHDLRDGCLGRGQGHGVRRKQSRARDQYQGPGSVEISREETAPAMPGLPPKTDGRGVSGG